MPAPEITGFAVLAGSRIIVPVEVASLDASAGIPSVGTIGTLLSGHINTDTGTIGTIISGAITATILSGQLANVGTIGTILSGQVTLQPASYVFTNVTATIKGSSGILYQINAAGESGLVAGPGTLLVLDSTATVTVIPVAAGGYVPAPFRPGVTFGTLIASIIGSVDATFVIK